jgi:hypothetical protein
VMPSSRVARTLERIQLYLASLEWPLDDRTLALRTSAWCLRGRIVRTSTRRFPRPQVSGVDPAEIKLRE